MGALRAVEEGEKFTYQALVTPAAYCASKGAVVNLTRQIAVDYAKDRIHCNALCPGCKFVSFSVYLVAQIWFSISVAYKHVLFDGPVTRTAMTKINYEDAEVSSQMASMTPWGEWGNVVDVAKGAVFLASDDAAWVTGVPLPVDGGYVAQ